MWRLATCLAAAAMLCQLQVGNIAGASVFTDLGALASGDSRAFDINDHGVIVGESRFDNGSRIEDFQAIRWVDGVLENLGGLHGANYGSATLGFINNNGVALGRGWSPTNNPRLLLFQPDGSFGFSLNAEIESKTGGRVSSWVPRGLNNRGDMLLGAGRIWINDAASDGLPTPQDAVVPGQVFPSSQGDGYLISDLPNFSVSAINDHRVLAGNTYVDFAGDQAAVWQETRGGRQISVLGGFGADRSNATAISNSGLVAGELSYFAGGGPGDGPGGGPVLNGFSTALSTGSAPAIDPTASANPLRRPGFVHNLATGESSFFGQPGDVLRVTDINDAGQVVGYDVTRGERAFVVRDGVLHYLDDQVEADGWSFAQAAAINNHGQVVGTAIAPTGNRRGFLIELGDDLTPPQFGVDRFLDSFGDSFSGRRETADANLRRLYFSIRDDPEFNIFDDVERAQASYMLATTLAEVGADFAPIHERGLEGYFRRYDNRPDRGNDQAGDGFRYRGRGYVQLTWKNNYRRIGDIFGVDLVANPELALEHDLAYQIMSHGMRNGSFTTAPMDWYINEDGIDYVNARRVINGNDRDQEIAGYARMFQQAFEAALPLENPNDWGGLGQPGPGGGPGGPVAFASVSSVPPRFDSTATLAELLAGGSIVVDGATLSGWEVYDDQSRGAEWDANQIAVVATYGAEGELEVRIDFGEELRTLGSYSDSTNPSEVNFHLRYSVELDEAGVVTEFEQTLVDPAIVNPDPTDPGGLIFLLPTVTGPEGFVQLAPNEATFVDRLPAFAGETLRYAADLNAAGRVTVDTLVALFGDSADHTVGLGGVTHAFTVVAVPEPSAAAAVCAAIAWLPARRRRGGV